PGEDIPEQVILDVNQLAEGQPFMALGASEISDDGHLLAYSTDNTGFRQYRMHIRDLRSGQIRDLPDTAENTGTLTWAADNQTLFYTVEDEAKRHYRLYRHPLGGPVEQDQLIYEETDERFNLGAYRTRSKQYVILQIESHTTTEARYLAAADPTAEFTMIEPRRDDVQYSVDHHGDRFYLRINDTGRNFRLISTPVATPTEEHWTEILPARPDVMLESVELFADFYVLHELANGLPVFRIGRYDAPGFQSVEFPEPTYTASPSANAEFITTQFRYTYQSLVTPRSVFDYDVNAQSSTLLKEIEVPGYDRTQYISERMWATARDGVKVPISLVYRKDLFAAAHGKSPLYLYGYGSYGFVTPVGFSSNRLSVLDRGVVFAIAHIRGSGDLGKPWHDAGKMMHKMSTFTDFIDVTEFLISQEYGDCRRIAAEGGSAGGLLMGAITNLRPDLYRAIVSHVPFVDVMNTMLDASLPLTVAEYEEWGDPNQQPAYEYMRSYSPYDNLKPVNYPAILVKTSFHDSQVMYWEPAKYVAKLRTLKQDNHPLLLKSNMAAGHGGASGRYDYLHEIAFDYAFLLWQLDVEAGQ
ncbi:MAG: S9 family peptidase, partial [Acidobacteriaceae bacterium]